MPEKPNPMVFVHGYSDRGASWAAWREILRRRLGLDNADMRTCTYVSLNNEVTIKDLAEAFDRALATQGGLDPDAPFDAVVHSTGMLVVRSWLAADPLRGKRLKRLIALAPATLARRWPKKGAAGSARFSRAANSSAPIFWRPETAFWTTSNSPARLPGGSPRKTC